MPRAEKPAADQIMRQLARVLDSRQFRRAPLLARILVFLTEAAVRGDVIRDATQIARQALGKGAGFSSAKDPSVRVAMNRLRSALQIYYADEGASDDLLIVLKAGSYRPDIDYRMAEKPWSLSAPALALSDAYQANLTQALGRKALHALQSALAADPDNPALLAAFADICIDSFKYGFELIEHPLDAANRAIEQGLSVTPNDPAVLFEYGMLALALDDTAQTLDVGGRIRQLHANSPDADLMGAWLIAHTMAPVEAQSRYFDNIRQALEIPHYYLEHMRALAAYQSGDYQLALDAAVNFGLPNFIWGPMLRAAAMAQLGLKQAAGRQLARVLELNPQFSKNPGWHIAHHLKHADTQDHLLEGLHKA